MYESVNSPSLFSLSSFSLLYGFSGHEKQRQTRSSRPEEPSGNHDRQFNDRSTGGDGDSESEGDGGVDHEHFQGFETFKELWKTALYFYFFEINHFSSISLTKERENEKNEKMRK